MNFFLDSSAVDRYTQQQSKAENGWRIFLGRTPRSRKHVRCQIAHNKCEAPFAPVLSAETAFFSQSSFPGHASRSSEVSEQLRAPFRGQAQFPTKKRHSLG